MADWLLTQVDFWSNMVKWIENLSILKSRILKIFASYHLIKILKLKWYFFSFQHENNQNLWLQNVLYQESIRFARCRNFTWWWWIFFGSKFWFCKSIFPNVYPIVASVSGCWFVIRIKNLIWYWNTKCKNSYSEKNQEKAHGFEKASAIIASYQW